MNATNGRALFVDMDGTLVATDVLWEAFVRAVKKQPWVAFLAVLWLAKGRATLKQRLSERIVVEPDTLPYHEDVLAFLRERKAAGDRLVLATASNRAWADPVAEHVGLFDDVIASDATHNLKGRHKLAAIVAYCEEHDLSTWGYMGDAAADYPIWELSLIHI